MKQTQRSEEIEKIIAFKLSDISMLPLYKALETPYFTNRNDFTTLEKFQYSPI